MFLIPYHQNIKVIQYCIGGGVMSELMPKVKGKAEGGIIGKIVKELLAPKEE